MRSVHLTEYEPDLLNRDADLLSQIRPLNPDSDQELTLVASRMRQTLIEVESQEFADTMYSVDWLKARLLWHLDQSQCQGQVFLMGDETGYIVGHTIIRIEIIESGVSEGLFSTSYIDPGYRQQGFASALLRQGEAWMRAQSQKVATTWTAATNDKLIKLYEKHGYAIVQNHFHEVSQSWMVKLSKQFDRAFR
ncbi:GNAT family N-acetyltransferase [Undibacterium jejuense]|uniref:GNAT family N-acetyltransferase n=1 Tax=Undibacterium jejuense TaxID=1344949 RepID=A0A923KQM5_9BURK|nr:GNAT family N-acetyltransferase [Undibacterium jejuense]MBC3863021.1 GNAT family N-acetyltransferase [Undibacterium jejuense]